MTDFIERVSNHRTEGDKIDQLVEERALEIAKLRGDPVRAGPKERYPYVFNNFEIGKANNNTRRYNADARFPDYAEGTSLLFAYFHSWCSGDCNVHTVIFPAAYIDDANWADLENAEWEKYCEAKRKETEAAEAAAKEVRRQRYENLKAEFGG